MRKVKKMEMEKKNGRGDRVSGERERERERRKVERETSLSDLRKSGRGFSSEQEVKSVNATRPTRGYQNLGVSSNSKK